MGELKGNGDEDRMKGISNEAEISINATSMFPGFRFSPSDEELILYYLRNKLDGFDKCVEVIPLLDICKFEPWDLPAKAVINSDQEWFFFSPRGKKYPNGSQSKRATDNGYWKATGKERAVKSGSNMIGTKRTLVFHIGRAPKGERTEWTMHEYCMAEKGQDALVVCRLRRKCDYNAINDSHALTMPNNSLTMIGSSGTNSGYGLEPMNMMIGSSGTNSGCGLEPMNITGGYKIAESSLKKSSSSHDSHSVEQMDSASQSDWKFKEDEILQPDSASQSDWKFKEDEILQPESSSQSDWKFKEDEILQPGSSSHAEYQRGNDEDDLFAEILNDNIVQLDECPPTSIVGGPSIGTNTTTTTISAVPRAYRQPGIYSNIERSYPSQGTANRRIRLRKLRRLSPLKDELEGQISENMISSPSLGRSWRVSILRRLKLRRLSPCKEELEAQIEKSVIASPKLGQFWKVSILRELMRIWVDGSHLFVIMIVTSLLILLVNYVVTTLPCLYPRE